MTADCVCTSIPPRCQVGLVLAGGILVHLTLGTIYTYGNLGPYIISFLRNHTSSDLSSTASGWFMATGLVGQSCGLLVGGWGIGRFGPKAPTAIGSIIHSSSISLTYFTVQHSLGAVLVTYGFLFGLGVGCAYAGPLSAAILWSPKRRGLFIGLMLAGFGTGAFIFNPVITAYINPDNYNANITEDHSAYFDQPDLLERVPSCFLMLGGTFACLQLIGCLFIKYPKREVEEHEDLKNAVEMNTKDTTKLVDGHLPTMYTEVRASAKQEEIDRKKTETETSYNDETARDVLRDTNFYILWTCFAIGSVPYSIVIGLYKVYGLQFIFDDYYLASIGSVSAIANALGRIFWGFLLDHISFKVTFRVVFAAVAMLMLVMMIHERIVFAATVCLLCFSFSGVFVMLAVSASKLYGQQNFGINFGLLWTSVAVSSLLATLLGQQLQLLTGWNGVFIVCSVTAISGAFLIFFFNSKCPGGIEL